MSGADARKRKKREQRKAHKAAQAQPHVQWGSVAVFSFSHVVGGSAVPSKGIYPISLGAEVEELRVSMPLDEHVSQTQADLLHRAQALGLQIPLVPSAAAPAASVPIPIPRSGKSGKSSTGGAATPPAIISKSSSSSGGSSSSSNSSSSSSSSLTPPPPGHAYAALETRQFDYRRGQHNQLFSPLTEEERRLVLVDMESWGSGTSLLSAHHTPPPRAAGSLEKRGDAALLGEGDSRTPPRASAGGGGADSRKQRSNSATSVTSVTDTGSPGLPGSAHATAHTANTHHVAEHHKEIRAIQKSRSEHLGAPPYPSFAVKSAPVSSAALAALPSTLSDNLLHITPPRLLYPDLSSIPFSPTRLQLQGHQGGQAQRGEDERDVRAGVWVPGRF